MKLSVSYIVKLNFLVLGLLGVIFAMYKIQSGAVSDAINMMMGVKAAEAPPPPGTIVTQMDWCDTRVRSLGRPGKPTLRQEKLKWLWQADPTLELNFIAVEKWFGRYCRVKIERLDPDQLANAAPVLVVEFIKGAPETLLRSVAGVYKWRQEIFRSQELDQALEALEKLPESGTRTSH
ncbi:MAG: hypothetical protein AB7N80_07225 [Bdellovibrionales bacterium]